MAFGLNLSTLANLGRATSRGIEQNTAHNRRTANQRLAKAALSASSNPDPEAGSRQLAEALLNAGDADVELINHLQNTQIQLRGLARQAVRDEREEMRFNQEQDDRRKRQDYLEQLQRQVLLDVNPTGEDFFEMVRTTGADVAAGIDPQKARFERDKLEREARQLGKRDFGVVLQEEMRQISSDASRLGDRISVDEVKARALSNLLAQGGDQAFFNVPEWVDWGAILDQKTIDDAVARAKKDIANGGAEKAFETFTGATALTPAQQAAVIKRVPEFQRIATEGESSPAVPEEIRQLPAGLRLRYYAFALERGTITAGQIIAFEGQRMFEGVTEYLGRSALHGGPEGLGVVYSEVPGVHRRRETRENILKNKELREQELRKELGDHGLTEKQIDSALSVNP
tara:strand:- start:6478 stop:7677 length:1200 start_codon:yes stop_codon:yes gene_type:complete